MAKAVPDPPPGFDELTVKEKIEYAHSLWDRVMASPEEVPVPEGHLRVLNYRLESHRTEPDNGKTWEQVRDEDVRRKLRGT